MLIRCPHCQSAVELVDTEEVKTKTCPSCGSQWSFFDETVSLKSSISGMVAHFELLEHVGRGHFGDVCKARDTKLGRIVAVKIPRSQDLDGAARAQFLAEARAVARLRHPNIVAVHEVGASDEMIYIVSDFIDGVTLAELVQEKRLPFRQSVELCIKVGGALDHAHGMGIIHRDLKPQNILIDTAGEPYVTDFGLAKQDAAEVTMTAQGVVLGTPAYMPPEQARGDAHSADQRSDVYSLGVILYELLSGSRPFKGSGKRVLLYQIQHDDPVALKRLDKHVPRDLETICLKAMAKDPGRRYQTAGEMVADLRRFLEGEPIRARRTGLVERAWRWARRNPPLAAATAVAAVLAIVLLSIFAQQYRAHLAALRLVAIDTVPSGASVIFFPLDEESCTPQPELRSRIRTSPVSIRLAPGDYLVVAYLDDHRFHEVYRRVPGPEEQVPHGVYAHQTWHRDGSSILLSRIEIPNPSVTESMAFMPGSDDFEIGSTHLGQMAPPHRRRLPGFYLDTTEVSQGEYYQDKDKPSATRGCTPGDLSDDHAVVCLPFDAAVAYAEKVGKRLPTEAEYEYAATRGGKERRPSPSADDKRTDWTYGPVGQAGPDRVDLDPTHPVFGLYSNVAEWTATRMCLYPANAVMGLPLPAEVRHARVVRGAPEGVADRETELNGAVEGPCARVGMPETLRKPGLGFRCARTAHPRLRPEDFEVILDD